MNIEIVKTKTQIQNKWDTMLCRWMHTGIRLKESYYEIARFATGCRFEGSRQELHRFVVSLDLDRMVEITAYKGRPGVKAIHDFKLHIRDHCKEFIDDCYRMGPIAVRLQIDKYKWKDLSHKRVMLDSRKTQDGMHSYSNKMMNGCSDWLTVK